MLTTLFSNPIQPLLSQASVPFIQKDASVLPETYPKLDTFERMQAPPEPALRSGVVVSVALSKINTADLLLSVVEDNAKTLAASAMKIWKSSKETSHQNCFSQLFDEIGEEKLVGLLGNSPIGIRGRYGNDLLNPLGTAIIKQMFELLVSPTRRRKSHLKAELLAPAFYEDLKASFIVELNKHLKGIEGPHQEITLGFKKAKRMLRSDLEKQLGEQLQKTKKYETPFIHWVRFYKDSLTGKEYLIGGITGEPMGGLQTNEEVIKTQQELKALINAGSIQQIQGKIKLKKQEIELTNERIFQATELMKQDSLPQILGIQQKALEEALRRIKKLEEELTVLQNRLKKVQKRETGFTDHLHDIFGDLAKVEELTENHPLLSTV